MGNVPLDQFSPLLTLGLIFSPEPEFLIAAFNRDGELISKRSLVCFEFFKDSLPLFCDLLNSTLVKVEVENSIQCLFSVLLPFEIFKLPVTYFDTRL